MSDKKVNVAIVGLGFGAEFIPIYQRHPNVNMYAICQRNPKKLQQIGDAFKIDKRYESYDDLLKDPAVDFVHINTPIPDHGPMSIAALKAGKHVMCTVPMATSIADCKKIVELVKKTGLRYMMAETVVYAREYLYVKELYDKGELGQDSIHPGVAPAGHGRLAELLAGTSADVVRDALCRAGVRDDGRSGRVRIVFWLRHDSAGAD